VNSNNPWKNVQGDKTIIMIYQYKKKILMRIAEELCKPEFEVSEKVDGSIQLIF
jgi:hypothetical protein